MRFSNIFSLILCFSWLFWCNFRCGKTILCIVEHVNRKKKKLSLSAKEETNDQDAISARGGIKKLQIQDEEQKEGKENGRNGKTKIQIISRNIEKKIMPKGANIIKNGYKTIEKDTF